MRYAERASFNQHNILRFGSFQKSLPFKLFCLKVSMSCCPVTTVNFYPRSNQEALRSDKEKLKNILRM